MNRFVHGGLDKYFTPPTMANKLLKTIPLSLFPDILWIEPAAGSGIFLDEAKHYGGKHLAIDIAPDADGIMESDWLETTRDIIDEHSGSILVYGNPPFGFGANQAVKFFNHAAKEIRADAIAFIVPKTFLKSSVTNRLDPFMHLHHQIIFSKDESMFLVAGGLNHVPCIWQIWIRKPVKRALTKVNVANNPYVKFVKKSDDYDLIIRRVGGRAGQILPMGDYSESSTLFLRLKQDWVMEALENADFSEMREMTAGVRSVSKSEIIQYLIDFRSGD